MHTCPFCGDECDCDMDDTGDLPVPDDCPHVCEDPSDDDYPYDDDYGDYCTCPRCGAMMMFVSPDEWVCEECEKAARESRYP